MLVGISTGDDAGVYRVRDDLAIVSTVDFFTPVVDDPYTFGAIAAANALSDVYAMGGRPITALSILAWPGSGELEILEQIKASHGETDIGLSVVTIAELIHGVYRAQADSATLNVRHFQLIPSLKVVSQ